VLKSNTFFMTAIDISQKAKQVFFFDSVLQFYIISSQHNHLCSSQTSANIHIVSWVRHDRTMREPHLHRYLVFIIWQDVMSSQIFLSDIPLSFWKRWESDGAMSDVWWVVQYSETNAVNLCSRSCACVRPRNVVLKENFLQTLRIRAFNFCSIPTWGSE
jgi:hypothetical protein